MVSAHGVKREAPSYIPVSYTHLDVYKRQEEPRVESFHYEGGLVSFITFLNENKEAINPTVITVSYTHLDVYKRQPLHNQPFYLLQNQCA